MHLNFKNFIGVVRWSVFSAVLSELNISLLENSEQEKPLGADSCYKEKVVIVFI